MSGHLKSERLNDCIVFIPRLSSHLRCYSFVRGGKARTLRHLRIAEVVKLDMKVEDGKVQAYRARVMLSFKYER